MISIRRSIDVLDKAERRFRASVEALARTLLAVERSAETLAGEGALPFRKQLESVRADLETAPEALDDLLPKVEEGIARFSDELKYSYERKEREYKKVIRIVTEAATTISQTSGEQRKELEQFTRRIESVSRLENIVQIRSQLSRRVSELKDLSLRIQKQSESRAQELNQEIEKVHERLKEAETMAETDALTGLGNRRKAEKSVDAAIASGTPFCLIFFDLDDFKRINDVHGHLQGDQLLKNVAREMLASAGSNEIVCRWGGDEFLVIAAGCTLDDAAAKADRIQSNTLGQYLLEAGDKVIRANVSAGTGIAEHRPGETAEALFERVDRLLYEDKRRPDRRRPAGAAERSHHSAGPASAPARL